MTDTSLYTRFVQTRLVEALTDSPVILVHGPRQCGKTTLARMITLSRGERGSIRFAYESDWLKYAHAFPLDPELPWRLGWQQVHSINQAAPSVHIIEE